MVRSHRALVIGLVAATGAIATAIVVGVGTATEAPAGASAPLQFAVSFDRDARLGKSTALRIALRASPAQPPVNEIRLLLPDGLELSSSALGVAPCNRPKAEVARVMSPVEHDRCPVNSLMGTGTARAGLRFSERETVSGNAVVGLYAGPPVDDRPGLLVTADTYNPARLQLTYAGYLYVPQEPYGIGIAIRVPQIPDSPLDSPIALADFALVVGRSTITYHKSVKGREVAYHPGGIPLSRSCPAGGFPFRAQVTFEGGRKAVVDRSVPCPVAG